MAHSDTISNNTGKSLGIGIALASLLLINGVVHAEDDGSKVYKDVCKSCHGGGIKGWLSGAPKAGKNSAWEEYFDTSLVEIKDKILNGSEKHEAMGEKEALSESQVGAAVDYIISLTPSLSEKLK